jgi:hypothetical protein
MASTVVGHPHVTGVWPYVNDWAILRALPDPPVVPDASSAMKLDREFCDQATKQSIFEAPIGNQNVRNDRTETRVPSAAFIPT